MQIRSCDAQLLAIPLERPVVSGMSSGDRGAGLTTIFMPVVTLTTDSGLVGRGYTWALAAGGTAMRGVIQEDIFAARCVGCCAAAGSRGRAHRMRRAASCQG